MAHPTYQLYENGELAFDGTAAEVSEKTGILGRNINEYVRMGYRIKGRWTVGRDGEPPVDRTKLADRSHNVRNRREQKPRTSRRRRGSPGHPIPFEKMSSLSQDVYLARQAGMSYGQYKGQTYKPMRKIDRMQEGILEHAQAGESEEK